jgi:26S proteasome regulatory subunit N5
MVRLALHQDDYLATTKHHLAVYHTPRVQENTDQARAVLQNVLIFVVLSPYGNEQSDLLARVVREDPVKNNQMGWVGGFVKRFTDGELMRYHPCSLGSLTDCRRWPMVQQVFGVQLRQTDIFTIDKGDGKGQLRWETLSKRVTEHVTATTTTS